MAKSRSPLQVSDKFLQKLKDLQVKVRMTTGKEKSLRELTDELVSTPAFEDLEKRLAKGQNVRVDFNIRFDKRLLS